MEQTEAYLERIDRAFHLLARTLMPEMRHFQEFGLTGPQFAILKLLSLNGPSKITWLADQLNVKPSAITVMIDRMEAAKLVDRRHDEEDRRVVLVTMTDAGAEVMGKAQCKSRLVLAKYFSKLEKEELDQYTAITEKLADIAIKYHGKSEN